MTGLFGRDLFAQNRRRRYEEERVELEAKLKELRSARAALTGDPVKTGSFR